MRTGQSSKAQRLALVVATVFALAGAAMPAAGAVDPIGPAADSTATWIVTLVDHVDAAREAPQLAHRQGGQLLAVYSHVLDGFAFTGSADAAAALARDPLVAHVEVARTLHAVEIAPNGILRTSAWAAHQAGYTGVTSGGTPVRVAVVDTGIKLDHPDLAPNIAPGLGTNCINPGQPANDDHGHGTHVAGTVAAAFNGGDGVVGMATNAQLIPVKVLNSTGYGTDAQVICGLDYVAALAQAQPGPYVVNMSLGDSNRPGETTCGASALHQAICGLTNAGVTVVAAAGNDGGDASSFVPAAYDEVIAVSAFTDFDGQRSFAGCQADFSDYLYQCDDTLADFSNYGSVIDVTAPGVHVLSDWIDGGLTTISGTSMAAPHVAGAAALVLAANPSLTPTQVRAVLQSTGECPDGAVANAPTCAGHGQWEVGGLFGTTPDKDGIPEPLINALRAAQAAGTPPPSPPPPPPPPVDTQPPAVALTAPAANVTVHGAVTVSANATDNVAVAHVDFYDGSALVGTDSAAPYSVSWITGLDGPHTLTAIAYDTTGLSSSDSRTVFVDNTPPDAAVTSPSGGSVAGTITISADSSDPPPGSGVASVLFLVDGNVIATDTSAPFSTSWNTATVTNGAHSIVVRATDGAGNVATSPSVQVTVDNVVPVVVTSINNLSGSGQVGFSTWTSWVDVSVIDQYGQPVAGATVTFAVSGGTTTTRSCTTATNGSCSTIDARVSLPKSKKAVTYTTTDVTRAGTNWDGARWAVTLRLR
jgi:subtilisin family serine protease